MTAPFTARTSGSSESPSAKCNPGDTVLNCVPLFISGLQLSRSAANLDEPTASYVCLRLMQVSVPFRSPTRLEDELRARELSRRIRERVLQEGFEKVGIVAAAALDNERNRLIEWLGRGHHGNMSWMARD